MPNTELLLLLERVFETQNHKYPFYANTLKLRPIKMYAVAQGSIAVTTGSHQTVLLISTQVKAKEMPLMSPSFLLHYTKNY